MKGEGSVVEMEVSYEHEIPPPAGDPETLPLLNPPVMLRVEHHNGEEIEEGSGVAACRICLEAESLTLGDELISPCMCKGTQQFVHRSCLDHWRSVKEGFAFSHCTTCKAQFHLRPELPEDYSWRKIKFKLFVARDVFLVFIAMQLTIAMLGGVTYLLDKTFDANWDRILPNHQVSVYYCIGVFLFFLILGVGGMIVHCVSMSNGACMDDFRGRCYAWACFPASMEACGVFLVAFIIIFTILGVAYGLLAATMGVQRIWQRHYHILTKHVLTQEYIVEDMHGQYEPPTLGLEHESRLRSLNLL